jgi:hypothetical protein
MSRPWLSFDELAVTARWVAAHQRADGAIPWSPGGQLDPWDHIQCAMALAVTGQYGAARAAFRYLARTQGSDGAWDAMTNPTAVLDPTRDSNHAAYLATGLWFLHRSRPHEDFLAEMWPTLDRAIGFVIGLQEESGAIWWATDAEGNAWPAPLVTGCSSIHGSLLSAERIAELLGHERPEWTRARRSLATALRSGNGVFHDAPIVDPVGHFSMDWYYPVLGGAVRGEAARRRISDGEETYLDGPGCRCVIDRPWYTVAETCELVLALDACGLGDRARELFEWVHTLRGEDGGYWTGIPHPDGLLWPVARPSWTAATVILAADALSGESPTSSFFRDLVGT